MSDLRDTFITLMLVGLLTTSWAYGMLAENTFYPAAGIMALDIPFNCQLQYYYPPEQHVNTLVLTCPGMEMMRLWPLSVEKPWYDDWRGPVNGVIL